RDSKVILCDFIWMGNHAHLLIVAQDAAQCRNFYMELQRKITEYVKRSLGLAHLNLWEGAPMLAEILDLEKAISRVVYFYSNPARAHLVETISDYPGLCSWQLIYVEKSQHSKEVPWIRFPAVRILPSRQLSDRQDCFITKRLCDGATVKHALTYNFDAWMKCFGICEPQEVQSVRDRIRSEVLKIETDLKVKRQTERRRVLGALRLKQLPIAQSHTPKKKQRAVFVLSSNAQVRKSYIALVNALCQKCTELYKLARSGVSPLEWPPGMFLPPLPPTASALAD
ncbi:MAG: hypothetical protein J0M12_16340, partial [Deltaproteobacteria bacterium]|nr:hypothetical protein [Deltaproteobacteria bacterium]